MQIFSRILIFFLVFGWLALFFAAIGIFYVETIVLSIAIALIFALYFLPLQGLQLRRKTEVDSDNSENTSSMNRWDDQKKIFYLVLLLSFAVSFAACYFATPTVFGGRDQGAIATAAMNLSKHHTLSFSSPVASDLFEKYGPGKSLNFPGFDFTEKGDLISRFPPGYTAFLAAHFEIFGLKGVQYANFLPLALFFVIFWIILREVFSKEIAFAGFLLTISFFSFFWFAKYTLTETYSLYLTWTGIYFLISWTKRSHPRDVWIALAFFALAALTRIEAILFFFLAASFVCVMNRKKNISHSGNFKKIILICTVFLIFFYAYLSYPAISDSLKNFAKAFLPGSTKDSRPSSGLYSLLAVKFLAYGILPYLVFGLAGIAWLTTRLRKNLAKPEFLVFFITFPAFFYLISPMITLDDPWLFRRFTFSVFPVLIFFSVYFLNRFFLHKIFLYISLIALFAANCLITARFIQISENKSLLPQIEKISRKFGPSDLVLVDRNVSGSGFSLFSEPLTTIYHRQAVYFFNAEDFEYIDKNRYEKIFLIGSLFEENPWYSGLVEGKQPEGVEMISNNFLEPSEKKFGLAQNVMSENIAVIWRLK